MLLSPIIFLLLALEILAKTTRLFVASYAGTISTLEISHNSTGYSLSKTFESRLCTLADGKSPPSWITLVTKRNILYCLNPGEGEILSSGTLFSLRVGEDGSLSLLGSIPVPKSAAHAAVFGEGEKLGVAYYESNTFETYSISSPSHLQTTNSFTFPPPTLPGPGPHPGQNVSLPHQVIPDPTGRFILIPDLGSDIVRVFAHTKFFISLVEQKSLELPKGTGPRHGGFAKLKDGCVYFYIASQISNVIHAFRVSYHDEGGEIGFEEMGRTDTRVKSDGSVIFAPEGTSGRHDSEVVISSDNRFLLVSFNGDASYTIPSPLSSHPNETIPSDTIHTYTIDPSSGILTISDSVPAGGTLPLMRRDPGTGEIFGLDQGRGNGATIGGLGIEDESGEVGPVCLVWDE